MDNQEGQSIQIDGCLYEGGGQMIRSSLALSLILHKQFTMINIRKNRPNPGINNQLRAVFSAFTQKLPKLNDQEVYFYPKFLAPKQVLSHSAASITLMMQCLVPTFTGLGHTQVIRIHGGTNVGMSPPLESIQYGLIPLLQKMNIKLKIQDIKPGYYPTGKGYIDFRVQKTNEIKPIRIVQLGKPQKVIITYYVKDTKLPGTSKQLRKDIKKLLDHAFGQNCKYEIQMKYQKVFGTKNYSYGIGCLILGQNLIWDCGKVGDPIQQSYIINNLQKCIQRKACLDQHHQDQLLIYAALAKGKSQIHVGNELTDHTKSLFYILHKFIPNLHIEHNQHGIIQIQGIGLNLSQ